MQGILRHMAMGKLIAFQLQGIITANQQMPWSLRDPETRGLLTERKHGLWNCHGSRLPRMRLLNLLVAGIRPKRSCPWL